MSSRSVSVGHQSVSGLWSNKERPSLTQDPSNIARQLARRAVSAAGRSRAGRFGASSSDSSPASWSPSQPLNQKSDTWAVFYNFDQYLWQPTGDPKRGIGLFFTFGASDGNPNPIKYSYNMGIGGNGVVPGRPNDTFGLGWARTELSGQFVPFLRQNRPLGLNREDAIEMYYNAALTPWLNATADLQIINPALDKSLGSNGQLKNVDTAVVAGLRIYARF